MLSLLLCFVCVEVWILILGPVWFVADAGSSVVVCDDPTSRGSTAADPQSSAAPGPAPAAESTDVTPGTASSVMSPVHHNPHPRSHWKIVLVFAR